MKDYDLVGNLDSPAMELCRAMTFGMRDDNNKNIALQVEMLSSDEDCGHQLRGCEAKTKSMQTFAGRLAPWPEFL